MLIPYSYTSKPILKNLFLCINKYLTVRCSHFMKYASGDGESNFHNFLKTDFSLFSNFRSRD